MHQFANDLEQVAYFTLQPVFPMETESTPARKAGKADFEAWMPNVSGASSFRKLDA